MATGTPLRQSIEPVAAPPGPVDAAEGFGPRGRLLRCLTLPESAVVLEIDCGEGDFTAYLSSRGGLIDAIDADAARACRARGRIESNAVEVFATDVASVPREAIYDLVMMGDADRTLAREPDAIEAAARLLAPGGSLVMVATNPVGVAALARAKPTTGVVLRQMEDSARRADLNPASFGIFPNVDDPRVVMDIGALAKFARSLVLNLPLFPSPDPPRSPPRAASEAVLWESFVDAGIAPSTTNAFLVIASRDGATPLWSAEQLARYWSIGRRETQSSEGTVLRASDGSIVVRREPLSTTSDASPASVVVISSTEPFVDGEDMLRALARTGSEAEGTELLERWNSVLSRLEQSSATILWDAVPHNMIVTPDALVPIDQEWQLVEGHWEVVRRRGLFWAAARTATSGLRPSWTPVETVADTAERWGELIGLRSGWIDDFITEEAHHVVGIWPDVDNRDAAFFERQLRALATATPGPTLAPPLLADAYRTVRRRAKSLQQALGAAEEIRVERDDLTVELVDARDELNRVKQKLHRSRARVRELGRQLRETD